MDLDLVRIYNADQTAWIDVLPERGGIITQWNVFNRNILYLDQDRFADPTLSICGGMPILFPICGNLPDDTYTHKGKSFQLELHGFAHNFPWTVIHHTKTALELSLDSSLETLSQYPFEFQLHFTYALEGNGLLIRQTVINHSSQIMPFSIGFHPYFAVADKTTVTFEIPATQFLDQRTQNIHSSPHPLTLDGVEHLCAASPAPKKQKNRAIAAKKWLKSTLFPKPPKPAQVDVAFFPVTAQRSALWADDLRIELTYDEAFTTVVLWTVEGQPYVCLEPWSAQRNALNTGIDLLKLDPGNALETEVKLTVQPLTS